MKTSLKKNFAFGFTLVELIVVITILAVLATIGFLALSGYSQDAKDSATRANVRSVQTAISAESALTGNSPRYYVVHDSGAALSGAFAYVDGVQTALTGGDWNQAGTNYSAGNPDYAKLRMNPEKFKVSALGEAFREALAAYDSRYLTVGAMDASAGLTGGGKKRTTSYFQVAGISPATGAVAVSGNYPASSGSVAGLVKDPKSPFSTGALTEWTASANSTPVVVTCAANYANIGGTCVPNSCLAIKTADVSAASGTYSIDIDGTGPLAAFDAYCDMVNDGGGWTLVGAQVSTAPYSGNAAAMAADIGIANFGSANASWRLGSSRVSSIAPTVAWKLQSRNSSTDAVIDTAYFKKTCVVSWSNTWNGTSNSMSTDCQNAYTTSAFTAILWGANTGITNCSVGIGQNNGGAYCSMRMGDTSSDGTSCGAGWVNSSAKNCTGGTGDKIMLWFK